MLAQSNASSLLARGEPVEEILEALRPVERAAIAPALTAVRHDLLTGAALGNVALEYLMDQIAGFVKLTGGGWHPDQRQEFIEQALVELAHYPAQLVDEAIAAARKRVHQPARFVSWIVETIEPQLEKLRVEERMIARLAEVAGIQ